ncbi:DUF4303 domain-containing protein [Paeniglutamicibacter gangotriensis]|uniref:DUF4303 domain-containing protein n=1 Tax=Paeniglutamicibacter gangotriensis Lz1y TaxID=1276920 RepID=M7MX39_9MICC|nr:DUF4303 domain-containing protein [Paeniglutamicibacter gangotriensis]EMQ99520.1 hypothetical protein ADIAG_01516 [Paeniglutamicibacter gangotriensis Lz1y]
MGVDWTALEEAIRVSALRQAEEIIDRHPDEVFYAVALDGVSADETDHIDLPVLALNSEEALTRALAGEDEEKDAEDFEEVDEDERFEERADADDDGSDRDHYLDEDSTNSEDDDDETAEEDEDDEDIDDVLKELDALTSDAEQGYFSSKWNPNDWQWSPIELFDESATELWSQALTSVAKNHGWDKTNRLYYEMLIRVTESLRKALAAGRNADVVVYLSDDDHGDELLRRCLTEAQLTKHFPELAH